MAKQELYESNVIESNRGIFLDTDPSNQPKGTRRFTLNAIEEASDGQVLRISNEPSNGASTSFTGGFIPIGDQYIKNDTSVVILTNPNFNKDEIGIVDRNGKYIPIVNTGVLGLSRNNQCDIVFRLRRGKERVIYWVDGNHHARTFNLDRPQNFYNQTYQTFIRGGGDPLTFLGEKWDASSFDLIKSYSGVPTFGDITVIESGNILPGSYSFAIQLVDDDLNPTGWITTSNTVNIYNDTTNNSYGRIRGSRNVQNDAQNFPRTSKSIKIVVGNLDQNFPFYRIAIIRAAGNTGKPEKVLVSDLFPTSDSNFIYTGNDGELTETNLGDILIDNTIIYAPKHIEQLENRLILANGQDKGVNWCDFQAFASKIATDVVYKEVLLNNINSEPNVKNPNSTWIDRGYMPGEVYSLGIVFLFDDMSLSPVFHIPGRSEDDTPTSSMKVYTLPENYLNIHNCATDNYWGIDAGGNALLGTPIRHHRFPFRHEVSKPLVTSTGTTTDITKHRLKVTITLNPAWTPGPITYPDDGAIPPVPLVINYTINYQVHGAGSTSSFSSALTKTISITPIDIIIYDDTADLDFVTGSVYTELDPACDLFTTYQTIGATNDRFIITETKEDYVLSSSFNDDVADIFGLKFSNIIKPREDVIGFYIVRNERLDDDRLIIDNAIFGPNTTFQQYISFGLIMPKQYYHVDNCGTEGDSGKTVAWDNKSLWFFNPEFQYLGKRAEFDTIEVEGTYSETSINMPTVSNNGSLPCNIFSTKGVYINDVQAGTTYDPSINKKKNKDDDGFDLIIGYRNTNVVFTGDDNVGTLNLTKKRIIYLNAASYLNISPNTFYNVSVDNKIGMYTSDDTLDLDIPLANGTDPNRLLYGSLVKNNTTAYSNFLTRPYFKEHNNPVLFGDDDTIDDFEVFNGDTEISGMSFISSTFYDIVVADRPKKSSLWKIIVGAVLVVAGVVLALPSGGTSLGLSVAGATALASLAISYGISLAVSGIKFDQFKSMIDVDYELGLKDTISDGGTYETIRDDIGGGDDTIRWFADRVTNLYIESSVPFGLRAGLTSGVSDFIDAPAPYDENGFRSYLTEKLTAIDRNQGSGRIYKGYATAEFYDMNLDYMRFNHEKEFIHLPVNYDCCSDPNGQFPLRRWWSEQSFQEEKIDNYRVFLPNNFNDMEGEHGEITDMYKLGNNLFMHTEEALWQQPANLQERITDEIVTFIGTGEFFAIKPRMVVDSDLGSAGTRHKWATVKTPDGVFFIDEIGAAIYVHEEKIKDVTDGIRNWCANYLTPNITSQIYNRLGVEFAHDNNPANPNGVGYLSSYDVRHNRVIFTKKDYALLPDKLALLNLLVEGIDYDDSTFLYDSVNGTFFIVGGDDITFDNTDYFENRSWTLSHSLYTKKWASWHSYLPNYYIHSPNNLYSYIVDSNLLWKHNIEGSFGSFYGVNHDYIIELVPNSNPLLDKTTEDVTMETLARVWSPNDRQYRDERYITFDKIMAYNSRQNSGVLNIVVKDTQANPENYYRQQITNVVGEILATRKGRNWNINDLRDYIIDPSKPMFSENWANTQGNYYIDKVPTPNTVDFNKSWQDLESFRDKYIIIRLIFSSFNNVNLTLSYTVLTEQITEK